MILNRRRILGVLLVCTAVLAAVVLAEILQTVVFAITVAYVLYPLRQQLVRRGFSRRVASALSTIVAFLVVVLLIAPVLYVVYRRRSQLFDILGQLPDTVPITVGSFELVVEMGPLVDAAQDVVRQFVLAVAGAAPRLILALAVFSFLVYGILSRPNAVRTAAFRIVPPEYHDIPIRLHLRTRSTLYSIYVIQAATAAATFLLASVLFWLLGYDSPISLAVIAGILQFIPVLGPSILVVGLAVNDLLIGATTRGILVLVFGLVVVSFIPDAVIRTRLAARTGKISAGLYFVGFVGGILTVGPIGLIVGPLVVTLLLEIIELLSERESRPHSSHGYNATDDT